MPRSHVDSAECTTTKSKKSATITSSLYEARAGTALTTDYKSVVRLHHLEKPANKLNLLLPGDFWCVWLKRSHRYFSWV